MTETKQARTAAADKLVVGAVLGLPQMKDKTLIHLSVVGSRGKGISGADSDYDVKAIVLHSMSDYLLQNVTPSKSFETSIVDPETSEIVEVEATLVDYLTFQKYALSTNQAAYCALYGHVIYRQPQSQYLEELFLKAYDPRVLMQSFQGLMGHDEKRAVKRGRDGEIKHVANMVYYASIVHLLQQGSEPPPQNAFELAKRLQVEPPLRNRMIALYQQRVVKKTRTDVDAAPFAAFIQSARALEPPPPRARSKKEIGELGVQANARFLEHFRAMR